MTEDTYGADEPIDDGIRHGLDDDPTGDAEKGAVLGGLGGAAAGAAAGSMAGPMGALAGAAIGGVAGAVASGLAVGAIDRVDNDNTFSGIGDDSTPGVEEGRDYDSTGRSFDSGISDRMEDGLLNTPSYGSTAGTEGRRADDPPISEIDDLGARRVAQDWNVGEPSRDSYDASMDTSEPGIQTGGTNADGSPDTRGIMEKTADTVTGDEYDDKTGKRI